MKHTVIVLCFVVAILAAVVAFQEGGLAREAKDIRQLQQYCQDLCTQANATEAKRSPLVLRKPGESDQELWHRVYRLKYKQPFPMAPETFMSEMNDTQWVQPVPE